MSLHKPLYRTFWAFVLISMIPWKISTSLSVYKSWTWYFILYLLVAQMCFTFVFAVSLCCPSGNFQMGYCGCGWIHVCNICGTQSPSSHKVSWWKVVFDCGQYLLAAVSSFCHSQTISVYCYCMKLNCPALDEQIVDYKDEFLLGGHWFPILSMFS